MTATNYDGDGARPAVAETSGDWLMGWSVVGVGVALGGLPLLGVTGRDSMFTTAEVVPPLLGAAAVVATGLWLRRSTFTPGDVATVAVWVATTAVGIGFVSGLAALVLTDDAFRIALYFTSFTAPIAAAGGVVAGYTDARRRRQYRQTKRTQRAIETATDGIAILDEDGRYVSVNRAHAAIYGYDDPEALVGQSSRRPDDPDRLRVVDCTGARGRGSMDDTETIKYVRSPGDLTGIGMGIVKCTREIGPGVDDGLRMAVLSLSTLLRYANADRSFNFLHTVTGRVSAAGYLGLATFDPTSHDPGDGNTLSSLFDVVVELREADDGSREVRVVGHREASRTWQPY